MGQYTNYTVLASESTVIVLSPTLTEDGISTTFQTQPHGVIVTITLPQATFDANDGPAVLERYATGVEEVMALDYVVGGQGVQTIDESGLIADGVSFTVAYQPLDAQAAEMTASVTVTAQDLGYSPAVRVTSGTTEAKLKVADAYAQLRVLAGDALPAPSGGSGGGGTGTNGGGTPAPQ
jgi:hypothetical protein